MTEPRLEVRPEVGDRPSVAAFDIDSAGATRPPKSWLIRLARKRRWAWLGRSLQVQQRFEELRGNELAAALTLQLFLGLFPLILVGVSIVGFLQAGDTAFASRVIENLGLTGDAADQLEHAIETAANSRQATTILGLAGLLWAGLGVTSAFRLAFNRAWQVDDRGFKDRLAGLLWFLGIGALFLASAAVVASLHWLPAFAGIVAVAVGVALGFVLFLWSARTLTHVDVGWRAHVPGAVVGGVGLVALQIVGAFVVPRMVASASALWGTLGVVFALLAWLLFFGRLVVYAAIVSVVLFEGHAGTVVSAIELPRHDRASRAATRAGTSRPISREERKIWPEISDFFGRKRFDARNERGTHPIESGAPPPARRQPDSLQHR
jgi:membrane protein